MGSEKIVAIAHGAYLEKSEKDIRGSGYVVDSLEATMWCFFCSRTFAEAVLMAANLGDDADTTAAVCGQVAGAYLWCARHPCCLDRTTCVAFGDRR
ncbi:MAG: ADP-ribosylglycohydrolase family protein [Roseiflexus sp.]|nr:ADP-ribosylglycohydrolase family protein [Roseiflexus sp.]